MLNNSKKYRSLFILSSLILWQASANAQLIVSGTKTPTQLVQDVLLGTGVTVSNVSYTGSVNARGEFDGVNANIGFDAGVLLTSGRITLAPGPNNSGSRSGNNSRPGDADINAIISPTTSRDACVLEFDFYVPADTIFFDYIFGSEEYPEYAPPFSSTFNDAFAFLLSGPNPAGGNYNKLNIAKIPGSNTIVSINNVNAVTNNSYYVNNGNGSQFPYNSSSFYVQYDGFTVPLTATAAVVPCALYHIKLVVADAADFVYDSGVFLKANSFGSNVKNPTIDYISTAPACHGDSVDFLNTGTSSAGILYSWDFGAGATPATSALESPNNIVYSSPGLKLVTLNMNVNCGDTTLVMSKGITIDEKPAPSFTSNAPQCEGQPVNFTYNGSTGSNWIYHWDFGQGASPNTSSAQNPTGVKYQSPGLKTITLTATNGNCSETYTQTISISDRPTASFSNTGPVGIGYGVNFTNTGTTGATYSWNFGSGSSPSTSVLENPINISYSGAGTKAITLITSTASCADTTIGFMDVLLTPAPSFTSNAPQPVGFPLIFSYNGSTGNNFTYSWDFGTGAIPSTSNSPTPPSIYYGSPGVKTITLTVTNGPIVVTITQTITIDQPPQPATPFTSTAPNCEGAAIDFQVTAVSGATYNWDFGTGATPATSTLQNPSGIVYANAGFKTVRLITSLGGNNDTSDQVIYIIPQPKPVFAHNGPQCEGTAINFTYSGNTGTGWMYAWDFGTGATPSISSAVSPNGVLYNGAGSKIVRLSVTNGFCSAVDTQMIVISPTPTATFSSTAPSCTGDSVSFLNTGSVGLTYSWNFGSGSFPVSSGDENPSGITYSAAGIKTVTQVVSQGLCSDSSKLTINVLGRPQIAIAAQAAVCQNTPVSVSNSLPGNTAWSYNWDFGNGASPSVSGAMMPGDVTYSNAGNKIITLTASNQYCAAIDTQIVRIDTTPVAQLYSAAPACQGDTFDLFASGFNGSALAYSFAYKLFSTTAFHDAQNGKAVYMDDGIQKVRLTMGIGNCYDSTELSLNIRTKPLADFTTTAPVCRGEGVDFINTGDNGLRWNYRWDFGTAAFPGFSSAENPSGVRFSSSGKHLISLKTHDIHCSSVDTLSVWINELPTAEAGIDTIICADDCIEIGTAGKVGYSYKWFPANNLSDANIANPEACPSAEFTQYILRASIDSTGCAASDTVHLTMLTSALSEAGPDIEICFGDSAQIGAALIKGQTYQWAPDIGLSDARISSPLASPEKTTKYNLRVSYKNCTEIEDEVVVTVRRTTARAGEDITLSRGESTELKGSGGITYNWTPQNYLTNTNISNPISTPEESIQYILEVIDAFNCKGIDSVDITVVDPDWFIPSAFTPDGSGRNDVFRVRGESISNFEMSVFDRFGSLVYFSNDFYAAWDGNSQQDGSVLAAGAYVYRIRGIDENGEEVVFNGLVNLIR